MTLLIFNSAVIVIPVSLGRGIFNAIPLLPITHGIKCNGKIEEIVLYYRYIWDQNAEFFFSFRSICFHYRKLCHLDCVSWSQVFHRAHQNKKGSSFIEPNLEMVWYCHKGFCAVVIMGKKIIILVGYLICTKHFRSYTSVLNPQLFLCSRFLSSQY